MNDLHIKTHSANRFLAWLLLLHVKTTGAKSQHHVPSCITVTKLCSGACSQEVCAGP